MKYIKRFLICMVSLILALSAFIYIGSIDTEDVNDQGLSNSGVAVSDAENGFTIIQYIVTDGFDFMDGEQRDQLKSKIASPSWDRVYAENMLAQHSEAIADFSRVAEYDYIQFPRMESSIQFPPYTPVMDMARLALLKSRYLAETGELDEAIVLTEKAVHLAVTIKAQPDENILAYMISLAMQHEALNWLYRLAHDYPVGYDQLTTLLAIVKNMPIYETDGFREVFAGEYRFSTSLMAEMADTPLHERWEVYRNQEDYWNMDIDGDGEFGREDTKQEMFAFLSAVFPKFYAHQHRAQNLLAEKYKKFTGEAALQCNQLTPPVSTSGNTDFSWLSLITPNSMIKQWDATSGQHFYEYFYRRCLAHAQIEATKALIAINMFQIDHEEYPATLEALQPKYIDSLPIDPFDGAAMRYSKKDAWVYSVGRNFEDDGGSVSGCFLDRCYADDNCKNNPTFPLNPNICIAPESVVSEACESTEQQQEASTE